MTDAEHIGSIGAKLDIFLRSECGPSSRVADLRPMEDGHAGLTFGFDVINNASESLGSYVLKLAPAGVARRGNTDVYRQAPLLRGLAKAGMPVPAVPWASPREDLLGAPFIIMERLPGRIFFVWDHFRAKPDRFAHSGCRLPKCLRACTGSIGRRCLPIGSGPEHSATNSTTGCLFFVMPKHPR